MSQSNIKFTAVIGFPLAHSLSPVLHNAIYAGEGVDAKMEAIENSDVASLVSLIRSKPLELTAVTIPHKQTIIPLLDEVDEIAKKIGAVNTVVNRNGKLYGYNTDIIGIEKALLRISLTNKKILIVGAGGASRAVAFFLSQQAVSLYWYNRTQEKAKILAKEFGGKVVGSSDLNKIKFDVIVNTTPIGMYPNIGESPAPKIILRKSQTVFDIIYNPIKTKLLKDAELVGAQTINGLTMFVAQALAQEELWLQRKIENKNYENLLIKQL